MPTLDCTPSAFWQQFLVYVSPPVAALLSATALWVASKARGTSKGVRSTSEEAARISRLAIAMAEHNGYLPAALDRRKSSTRETTYTSRGDVSDRG